MKNKLAILALGFMIATTMMTFATVKHNAEIIPIDPLVQVAQNNIVDPWSPLA